jgi:hypothetical protein
VRNYFRPKEGNYFAAKLALKHLPLIRITTITKKTNIPSDDFKNMGR